MSFSRPYSAQTSRPKINSQKSSQFFKPDKSQTQDFFKTTRVDSCSHIIEDKNRCIAVPFKIINSKGRPLSAYKYTQPKSTQQKSIYGKDFTIKPFMHVGMNKKPLLPYDPNSFRSRLPTKDFFMPHSNLSRINIGNQTAVNTKQWLSTAKDSYQWPVKTPISNSGILSDIAKKSHTKLVAYN